ncbi:SLAP domain-containing protein [Companilactobacillus metriopterae]|uniref:SLAP domain-containing protein n=1 Tax=Companilactobacillus metriopterae TaxID=1909267 RepID=UPI00100A8B07|nr:SLAP domain-containing protein [Companilactobacillus metriopterae]
MKTRNIATGLLLSSTILMGVSATQNVAQAADVATSTSATTDLSMPSNAVDASGTIKVREWGAMNYSYRYGLNRFRSMDQLMPAGQYYNYSKTADVDGVTYYLIGQNLWVNSDDTKPATDAGDKIVSASGVVNVKHWGALVYTKDGANLNPSSRTLPAASGWRYSATVTVNGVTYYLIGNNTWVNSIDTTVR